MREKIKPSILPGFMELLPQEQRIFNDMVNRISKVYELNGLAPMDTPIIEKEEVLLAKSAGETSKQIYKFKKGDRDLALRFDLTVPLARYVAQYFNDLSFPFKRYQIGKAYRGERNQKGRYREFYQCDVDIIGNGNLDIKNDAFIISLASQAFKSIKLTGYKFQISNRKILEGIFEDFKIENKSEVMTLIDKYDKMDKNDFLKELYLLVGAEKGKIIMNIINTEGASKDVIDKITTLNISNERFLKGVDEIKQVIKYMKIFGVNEDEYAINLKIIRGLDYYTGTVFETFLCENESYGSICSGGRYDNLAENYTDNILPGVGISIGITRLFFVLKEIGFIYNYNLQDNLDYLILPIGETFEYCAEVSKILREAGHKVDLYLDDDKFKKKLNYANKIGVPKVIIIGEDEVNNREFIIKDMIKGIQLKMPIENIG